MATTPRFGLDYFGGDVEGSIGDNGGKFTRDDRLVLDRLLAAFEAHNHQGGGRLLDPALAPTLTLDTGAGQLESGETYYYTVTYVDQFGLETAASPEASVTTPVAVQSPQGPGLVTEAGGTLATGLYMYALTAHKGSGETTLSTLGTITVSDLTSVRVSIPGGLPTGATGISIWRQGPTETWFTRVRTQATAADWVDDGSVPASSSACEPANQPPSENTTESTNQVVVTAPAGELVHPTLARRWRIYRTTTSGVYGPNSLVADIVDKTTEGGNQLVTTYTDSGTVALTLGSPPLTSRTLEPSVEVSGGNPGAAGGMVLLRATNNSVWRMTADPAGQVETTNVNMGALAPVAISAFADLGLSLVDSAGVNWRVTVGTDGVLTVTQTDPVAGEIIYPYGAGPDLPTHDGAVKFRLGVDTDGDLTTHGGGPYTLPRMFISATQPLLAEGDVWLDIGDDFRVVLDGGDAATVHGPALPIDGGNA